MNKIRLGVDISKETLDFYCDFTEEHFVLQNSHEGLEKFLSWQEVHGFEPCDLQIAFEHTGHYGHLLETFCVSQEFEFYKIPALAIKKSLGIVRGKDDRIDAKRICMYLKEKGYRLEPSKAAKSTIQRLKLFQAQRALFVRQLAALKNEQHDLVSVMRLTKDDLMVKNNQCVMNCLKEQIKNIDSAIQQLIKEDVELNTNYSLITSVVGIGKVIGIDTLIATDNFSKFKSWREYAAYCGCAPYPNQSGKFIGRKRISSLANKELKAHLSSGAKSAMQYDQELLCYTERKLMEGKSVKWITNSIRCKLISRMFAVVTKKRPFEKNYSHYLAVQ
jgi:transposase